MWKRLLIICASIIFVALSLLVSSCFLSVSAATPLASEPQSVTLSYSEYNQLKSNLSTLARNSQMQRQRIAQLEELLQTASGSTMQSTQALTEARQELAIAKQQTEKQAQQLQTLNSLLETQAQQLNRANASLAIAQQSLTELTNELKKQQAAEKQSKVWAILATVTALYFAAR